MLQPKKFISNVEKDEQNRLDLFYCIVFLISYLSLKAIIDGNHFVWAAFTQKTNTTI